MKENTGCFLKNLSEFWGNYISGEFYALYSIPSVGKSLLLYEEAFNLMGQGYDVFWLDSETGFRGMEQAWKDKFEKKFNANYADKFHYYKVRSFVELNQLLGNSIDLDINKNGKIEVVLLKKDIKVEETIYPDLKGKKHVAFVLDSFTMIFQEQFNSSTMNFPARADASGFLFMSFNKLLSKTNGFMLFTHHASVNPINMFNEHDKVRGGDTVLYYTKYITYLDVPKKHTMQDFRKLCSVRSPFFQDWSQFRWTRIDDEGYHDSNDEEAEAAYNRKVIQ